MNLSTRRPSKEELWDWSQQPENSLLAFRVFDRFGNCRLVGIGSFSQRQGDGSSVVLADFVLSCCQFAGKADHQFAGENHPPLREARCLQCSRSENTEGNARTQSDSTTNDCRAASARLVKAQNSPRAEGGSLGSAPLFKGC